MNRKKYFQGLVEKYFNAEASESEEIRLRRFLAHTDDKTFDDVKAVMGYTSLRKRMEVSRVSRNQRWMRNAIVCACAVVAAFILIPSISADKCYMDNSGDRISDANIVMDAVDEQLAQFFAVSDKEPDDKQVQTGKDEE